MNEKCKGGYCTTRILCGSAGRCLHVPSAAITPDQGAAPLVGTGEMVLLPRELAETIFCHLLELRAEWQWKKNEPRAGNAREYAELADSADKLGAILHGQESNPVSHEGR